jgi:hypothetical protein
MRLLRPARTICRHRVKREVCRIPVADRDRDTHRWAPLPHHRTYGSRIRRFGWSQQTQIKLWARWALENETLPAFQHLLHGTGKNTLFDSHNHLPRPFGWGPFGPSPGWDLRVLFQHGSFPQITMPYALCWLLLRDSLPLWFAQSLGQRRGQSKKGANLELWIESNNSQFKVWPHLVLMITRFLRPMGESARSVK